MTEQPSVVIPRAAVPLILLTLVATTVFTYVYHCHLPTLLRYLARPPPQPSAYPALSSQLVTLRRQSNTLNTPATFVEWSKVQRQLQRLDKQLLQQQQQQQQHSHPLLVHAIVYASLAAIVSLLWWAGWSIVLAEVTGSEWLGWTPVRLLLGEVGVVRWSLVCYRVVSLLIAPSR